MLWRRISAPVSCVRRLALGERGGRLLEVDPVDLDPAPPGLHQRPGLAGQPGDLGGGELDVVEQHRPRHVAQLVGADDRAAGRLGEQPQRRRRLAPRQRRHAHVEAGGGEGRAGDGHQLPRLVLAERHLAAALRRRPVERREQPAEAHPLGGHRAAAALGPQRGIDRDRRALAGGRVHRQQPHPAGVGRVELHDQPGPVRGHDRARPLVSRRDTSPARATGAGTASRPCGR